MKKNKVLYAQVNLGIPLSDGQENDMLISIITLNQRVKTFFLHLCSFSYNKTYLLAPNFLLPKTLNIKIWPTLKKKTKLLVVLAYY